DGLLDAWARGNSRGEFNPPPDIAPNRSLGAVPESQALSSGQLADHRSHFESREPSPDHEEPREDEEQEDAQEDASPKDLAGGGAPGPWEQEGEDDQGEGGQCGPEG